MKSLKKNFTLLAAFLLMTSMLTSCASSHSGCPGKDRPSFRGGYGITTPDMKFDFKDTDAGLKGQRYDVKKIG